MTDDKGAGEGPYKILDRICFGVDEKHGRMEYVIDTEEKLTIANLSYADGRKAAENYTELMLKHATAEVRRCYEEIRRLEDKYARKFHRVPEPIEYGGRRI